MVCFSLSQGKDHNCQTQWCFRITNLKITPNYLKILSSHRDGLHFTLYKELINCQSTQL